MSYLRKIAHSQNDIALVLLVIGVLVVLFAPIPSGLLDFLILTNFSFAFLILLLTFYMLKPVEFSTFPSLLLITTLFRLSLNVAATRLILSDGDAGRVIGAVGAYVVGGNYVIGLIIFLILIVVQYVVVTNGAQRVSEVAARFTLDSLPGQQMSIDADLNMGFIDQAQAQQRRKLLEKEAGFYGAMDGASKFVKGDAIAGIIIMLINIVGGLIIGVMQHKMPWDQALKTYSLLTIGDGIVTQVPALVIAVATGIIVTRSASDGNLSREVLRQVTLFPKTLLIVSCALGGLLLMPGIPTAPTAALATLAALAALYTYRYGVQTADGQLPAANGQADYQAATGDSLKEADEDPYSQLQVDPIEVYVGSYWAEIAVRPHNPLVEHLTAFRKQFALEFGLVLPGVRFKNSPKLGEDHYEIHVDGVQCGRGQARKDHWLAMNSTGQPSEILGEPTKDPTYGLPATWIDATQKSKAVDAKYTVVDGTTVLMTHLSEILRKHSARLLSRTETERLLTRVRQHHSGLLEELIPTVLSVSDIQRVLQALLREKVSIRNIEAILETLADTGRQTKDVGLLTEFVRQRLGHSIVQSLTGDTSHLQVISLDLPVQSQMLQMIEPQTASNDGTGNVKHRSPNASDPRLMEHVALQLQQFSDRMRTNNLIPVLMCAPELRRYLSQICERIAPYLRVISSAEIPQGIVLSSYATVSLPLIKT